ncbi:MAG: SNF2-related protein, partial [Clostridiales bacterium]
MNNYDTFIASKEYILENSGFDVNVNTLNSAMFEFERDITRWALAKGKAAIFADCGLGKTLMQLEWANQIYQRTGGKILILAPLTVTQQTKNEGEKFGINANICESQNDVKPGINITNYEKLSKFDTDDFIGVVLDESSILKSFTGKVRTQIISSFINTPYRLACTATPAPN